MSFILDALKKSETDRQRQSGPSLFEVKVAPPRRRLPIWAAAIGVLLVINAVVVTWMLLRRPAPGMAPQAAAAGPPASTSMSPSTNSSAASPASSPASSPAASPVSSLAGSSASSPGRASAGPAANLAINPPAGPSAASSAAAAPPAASSSGAGSAASAGGSGDDQGAGEPAAGDAADNAPAAEPAGPSERAASGGAMGDLPLYQQIVASADLPPLHLDLHVYSDHPQDRFAMINMRRVGEGDSLPGGPRVEAIRPDGVVLSYHGARFLLPRN